LTEEDKILEEVTGAEYKYGFTTNVESDTIQKGLNEDVIRLISKKKEEPQWLLEHRLKAFESWKKMEEPNWANIKYQKPNYQDIIYYAAPKQKKELKSLDELDPEMKKTFDKLGISLDEQKKYLGTVVPTTDNFFSALNSAVFTDGSFCYIPKGVKCPMELSTYFRINQAGTGQFERTLVIADEGSYVSYLEGCTAPMRDENQLHAAVVELIAMDDAEIKYSTVQNWYPGDANGVGGVFNFVTKRGVCHNRSKISWTQVETGSAVTWKYPSCILKGDNSIGEFYSVAVTNNYQQADTGTKMIHLGKNSKSTIISKGICAGKSEGSYRGLVKIQKGAENARNFSQCDSLLMGDKCGSHTFPYIEVKNKSAKIEHEATTSKIGEDQIFYCNQRGIGTEEAIALIVNGYCKDVLNQLPMEFAVEAQKLLAISLEGSVG
jgi:Fe-S cluster assembly protein SufB